VRTQQAGVLQNIRWGLSWSLKFVVAYGVIAAIVYAIAGPPDGPVSFATILITLSGTWRINWDCPRFAKADVAYEARGNIAWDNRRSARLLGWRGQRLRHRGPAQPRTGCGLLNCGVRGGWTQRP
jgi:hypothetical protein